MTTISVNELRTIDGGIDWPDNPRDWGRAVGEGIADALILAGVIALFL